MDLSDRLLFFVLNSVAFYILLSTYASTSLTMDLLCAAALAFVFLQSSGVLQISLLNVASQQVQQYTHAPI